MIVRRGKEELHSWYSSHGSIFISSGRSPKGKLRPPIHTVYYQSWARLTGIKLKPGEIKEIIITEKGEGC